MIKIAVSLNVFDIPGRDERRDGLDQNWFPLLQASGIFPILIPNSTAYLDTFLSANDCKGLILTGGNSLVQYQGNAPERDQCELILLQWAIKNRYPVWGVCRGMQLVQQYFNIPLKPIQGYANQEKTLICSPKSKISQLFCELKRVRTFFTYGTDSNRSPLSITARSSEGVVLALEHETLPIYCQMWHSERHVPLNPIEISVIKHIFSGATLE